MRYQGRLQMYSYRFLSGKFIGSSSSNFSSSGSRETVIRQQEIKQTSKGKGQTKTLSGWKISLSTLIWLEPAYSAIGSVTKHLDVIHQCNGFQTLFLILCWFKGISTSFSDCFVSYAHFLHNTSCSGKINLYFCTSLGVVKKSLHCKPTKEPV